MAATETETKPAEQAATAEPADTADVDALLAQADALAQEAAQVVADEPQPGAEPSVQAEGATAEAAVAVEASAKAEPSVNSSSGIGSTLDDLDNLLEELVEKPPEEPASDDAIQAAEESSPAEGEADPPAAEAAGLEQQSPADTTSAGEGVSADVALAPPQTLAGAADDPPNGAAAEPPRSFPVRILHSLATPAVSLFAIINTPFGRLSPRLKNVMGYVAVGTFVVAIGLWVGGPSLVKLRALTVAEAPPSAGPAETTGASSHASSSGSKSSSAGSHSSASGSKASSAGSHSSSGSKASSAGSHSSDGGSHSSSAKPKSSGSGSHAPAKKSH